MTSTAEPQTTLSLMEPAKFGGSWNDLPTTTSAAAGEVASATTSSSSAVISKESANSASCLKELDYIGLAEVSSARSGNKNDDEDESSTCLKLEDTDLRLGLALPVKDDSNLNTSLRVQSPPVELELLGPKENKNSCPENATGTPKSAHMAFMNVFSPAAMVPASAPKNGVKRVYIDALGESASATTNSVPPTSLAPKQTQGSESKPLQESSFAPKWAAKPKDSEVEPPPAKDRVVGWPPVRSYRKNALASAHAGQANNDGESQSTIYVKVNMDGTPIGRKVDLNAYRAYECLLAALEEMFHSPSSGHSLHFLKNSEFVLTYEDKEGDWMLVGDVPWGMFVNTVRRLRIVRPSEATGVAPRSGKSRV